MRTHTPLAAAAILLIAALPGFAQVKGGPDADAGNSHASRTVGGPDFFGYTFFDQASGCDYQFIDISATGTVVMGGVDNDDVSVAFSLGAPFRFYGIDYNQLFASSNGQITTVSDTAFGNSCPLPDLVREPRIDPYWDDLFLQVALNGAVLYQFFPSCPRPDFLPVPGACSVVEWNHASYFDDRTADFNFEAVLYHATGNFVYQIESSAGGSGHANGGSATLGIQKGDLITARTYSCNSATVLDSSAVCWESPRPVEAIPTLSRTGLALLLGAIAGAALLLLRRRAG